MQSLTRRWRRRADHARPRRAMTQALESAHAPTLEAEFRAMAAAQFNR